MDFATRLVNLLHSCGWIKTEVFENDYNMVVDTSKKIMSMLYKRWLTIFRQYGVLGWIRVKTIIKECNVWPCILFIYFEQNGYGCT